MHERKISSNFRMLQCTVAGQDRGTVGEMDQAVRRNGAKAGCWAEPERGRAGGRSGRAGGAPDLRVSRRKAWAGLVLGLVVLGSDFAGLPFSFILFLF